MAKHRQETTFLQQCVLVCLGLNNGDIRKLEKVVKGMKLKLQITKRQMNARQN